MNIANPRGVCILGSTGSIGTQTLQVIRLFPEQFRIRALTTHSNAGLLVEQAREFQPDCVVITDPEGWQPLKEALSGTPIQVLCGPEALSEVATRPDVDTVVASIVGFAGLQPVLAAIRSGKRVALANKETLVVAGELVYSLLRETGSLLVPVDSEHSAIFQCLAGEPHKAVEKLILTASGGPFRTRPTETFHRITRDEALRHPNWSMGAKITVDSATMMNKGLEVIEAHWMFDVAPGRIDVLVHPQSVIHSMVCFKDGSTKAQLGVPDMKVPIQYALSYPERWPAPHERLDWSRLARLDFEPPDPVKFPCLRLAYEALQTGGTAPAVLNAANEQAVALFLQDKIPFTGIARMIEEALEALAGTERPSLEMLVEADKVARRFVQELSHAPAN
jgi:1-deoxy-D-xylulose-5-phosphate reductoisomerase